jgi:hypothetical protein
MVEANNQTHLLAYICRLYSRPKTSTCEVRLRIKRAVGPKQVDKAVDTFGNAKQILHSWYENMQAINLKSETC